MRDLYVLVQSAILILILYFPSLNLAQSVTTLNEAVELGISNNKDFQSKTLQVDKAQAMLNQSGSLPNPEIEFEYATDRFFSNENQYHLAPGLKQKLPIAGRLSLEHQLAMLVMEKAKTVVLNEQRLLKSDIRNTYRQLWLLEQALHESNELQQSHRNILQIIQKRASKAEISVSELNNQKIEIERLKVNNANLQIERQKWARQLNLLLGREAQYAFTISNPLPKELDNEQLQVLTKTALDRRPDQQLLKINEQYDTINIKLHEAERWEDWTLGLKFIKEVEADNHLSDRKSDEYLGLNLSIPLPLWNQSRGLIKAKNVHAKQTGLALQASNNQTKSQAEQALNTLLANKSILDQFISKTLILAKQNQNLIEKNYSAGLLTFSELIQSQRQNADIRSDYIKAMQGYSDSLGEFELLTNWFGE